MTHGSLRDVLNRIFSDAIVGLTGLSPEEADAQVRPSGDAKFGDYQCNAAMGLAKTLKAKPRELAERIKAAVEPGLADMAGPLEVAGPGFLNIRLRDEFLSGRLGLIPPLAGSQDRLGVPPTPGAPRVLVDYSSPNIAKQMHVGHIRSTIIGDALARVLAYTGHDVIRQNHIGDWGTAIGMVVVGLWYIEARLKRGETEETVEGRLAELKSAQANDGPGLDELGAVICREWSEDLANTALDRFAEAEVALDQLELGYRFVQTLTGAAQGRGWRIVNRDGSAGDITEIPRIVTRMLQQGGAANDAERLAWKRARDISLAYCDRLYRRLGVLLKPEDVCGESFYEQDDRLPNVVEEMRRKLAPRADGEQRLAELKPDQGALCLFQYSGQGEPRYRNADGDPLPMIIQKSDGAYLYATTDLAAIRYRIVERGARRLLYVVGSPQKLHLDMLFSAARAIGWASPDVSLEHVAFGQILGPDRKLLRTRLGGTVKLGDLLDEAERRALALLEERARLAAAEGGDELAGMSADEMRAVARHVGIAAVKYFDLNRDRNSDYVFDWDAMLSLKGNTAPYMMYAYARIRSIYRKASERSRPNDATAGAPIRLGHPTERALALRLLRFPEAVQIVAADLTPHVLCSYVYELAGDFMRFYDACPVLEAPDDALRSSRLSLCDLTARTLRAGLGLLGIDVIERM